MGYTRKKNKRGGKGRKGGAWWGSVAQKKNIKANQYRVSRNKNASCDPLIETPEIKEFIQLCLIRATIQRLGRFNITLEDIAATRIDDYPIRADPKFPCYVQRDEDATCIREYLKQGAARIVDSLFFSMREVEELKYKLRSRTTCVPLRATLRQELAAVEEQKQAVAAEAAEAAEREREEREAAARVKAAEAARVKAEEAARVKAERAKTAEAARVKSAEAVAARQAAAREAVAREAQAAKAEADARKAKAEAEIAKADAEKAEAGARKAKADAEKAEADARKANAEAEKAKVAAAAAAAAAAAL